MESYTQTPFPVSGDHESLTSDDPSGFEHDEVISSTDFIRIISSALKMAPELPVITALTTALIAGERVLVGREGCQRTEDETLGGAGGRDL